MIRRARATCNGGVPANSLTVRLRAKGNVVLRVPGEKSRKESKDRLRLPQPPQLNPFPDFPRNILDPRSLSFMRPNLKRDKNQLYEDSNMVKSTDLWRARASRRAADFSVKCWALLSFLYGCFGVGIYQRELLKPTAAVGEQSERSPKFG